MAVSRHAGPADFLPHVTQFFRGIGMTVSLPLAEPLDRAALRAIYTGEPLIAITDEIPLGRDVANRLGATIRGFTVDPTRRRAAAGSTLDDLLKGAASQVMQNANVALGFPERVRIDPWPWTAERADV